MYGVERAPDSPLLQYNRRLERVELIYKWTSQTAKLIKKIKVSIPTKSYKGNPFQDQCTATCSSRKYNIYTTQLANATLGTFGRFQHDWGRTKHV
eukprot:4117906-Amphidinium_carterae.1